MSSANKPQFLESNKVDQWIKAHGPKVVDIYDEQVAELKKIRDPAGTSAETNPEINDAWTYYPWGNTLLHCVNKDALFEIRTNRNRELIATEDQQKLADAVIGVVGMSVGAGIALASVYSGMSNTIKIADFDTLSTSNLNRLRESVLDVGRPKAELAAQRMYELDPFLEVVTFNQGINEENIEEFFNDPKLSVVVDEIDDFKMKVQLRLKAREHSLPLLMFTSLGDNILIDVERFDLEPESPIFHGLINDLEREISSKTELTNEDIKRYSVQLVGAQYIPTHALKSVAKMGSELVGRPQLYSTIAVDGGLGAYLIRQIILNDQPASGRYFVSFADLLGITTDELADSPERLDILQKL